MNQMRDSYRRLVAHEPCDALRGTSAVILAAGRGYRLSPLTDIMPKPLLPVLNLPLLLWATARLRNAGLHEVYANVHYLSDNFREAVAVCDDYGPRLRLVREARLTGPLGGVISCREFLESDICLVLSGDSLHDIDFRSLVAAHRFSGSELTLTTARVRDGWRYGVLNIDHDGFVTSMVEKPRGALMPLEHVSCGTYVISKLRLAQLAVREAEAYDFVDLVSSMLAAGEPVASFPIDGWSDVGTSTDLLNANLTYLRSAYLDMAAALCSSSPTGEIWMSSADSAPPRVRVVGRALLGVGATVEPGVMLQDVVVGAGARIGADAEVKNSVLLPGARVCSRARVVGQVVGP